MKRFLLFVLLVILIRVALAACAQNRPGATTTAAENGTQQFTVEQTGKNLRIVAYGDVRFMDPKETEASNPQARTAIVNEVVKAKPNLVIFTGDLVAKGGRENDWNVFVTETKPFRDANLKFFTLPGNHEFYGDTKLVNYFQHFPGLKDDRWYSIRAGNTLTLMLDSEADGEGGPQWQWVEKELSSVPDDVDFVLIGLHHPPYTKSRDRAWGGGHSARPQEQALAKVIEQHASTMRQKVMVLAGHVHNYERYEHGGVTYVVTGGGGATPYQIPRDPSDAYHESGPTYHFMTLNVEGGKLKAEMHKWNPQTGGFETKDKFELKVEKAKAAKKAA